VGIDQLPLIDQHSIAVSAEPDAVFDAVLATFGRFLTGPLGTSFSRLWRCDPPQAFEVVDEARPGLLVMAGKHRFSSYGIIFRITPVGAGATLSAESRAKFPGRSGRAYKTMVIGTHGHVVATRGLLRLIARSASR
jgi:hypothetical protein